MHKMFKPKTIRRLCLVLALAFPMVYLVGTLFFGLNGAHGTFALSNGGSMASVFSNPFDGSDFVTALGLSVLDGSSEGFAPIASLFQYVNANIFGFTPSNVLACFCVGYCYYAVNVLIVYELIVIACKLLLLPLKAVDIFDKED